MKMKDGSTVSDKRLGRLISFDERSREFPVRTLVSGKSPRAYTWRCPVRLDQGAEGSCVGHGVTHELAARPSEVLGMTHSFASEAIYWEAQKIDPWPGGEYPGASPRYAGTSVLAGIKVAQRLGYFDSYRWVFSLHDLILGVGYNGPAVMGTVWYEGMSAPGSSGMIRPTGQVMGGHCYLIDQVVPKKNVFGGLNSWGVGWGVNGRFYISFDDMDRLLHEDGEAVFPVCRHLVPIAP